MTMKHLRELIADKCIDCNAERERIRSLFEGKNIYVRTRWAEQYYSYQKLANESFQTAPFRDTSLSVEDFIGRYKKHWYTDGLDGFLTYCELIWNVVVWADPTIGEKYPSSRSIANQICENISRLLDKSGYKMAKGDDGVYYVEKIDLLSDDQYVNTEDDDVANALASYNRLATQGNISAKREMLVVLARAIEPYLENKYRYLCPEVFDDIKNGVNNLHIRHNNLEGKYDKSVLHSMPEEDLELLYDHLYSCILILMRTVATRDGHKSMIDIGAKLSAIGK